MTRPNNEPQPIVADRRRKIQDIVNMMVERGRIGDEERRELSLMWGVKPENRIPERFIGRHFTEIYMRVSSAFAANGAPADEPNIMYSEEYRLRERLLDHELMNAALIEAWASGKRLPVRYVEVRENIRSNVAREYGQIRPPQPPPPAPVEIRIVGVDPSEFVDPADPRLSLSRGFDDEHQAKVDAWLAAHPNEAAPNISPAELSPAREAPDHSASHADLAEEPSGEPPLHVDPGQPEVTPNILRRDQI